MTSGRIQDGFAAAPNLERGSVTRSITANPGNATGFQGFGSGHRAAARRAALRPNNPPAT
jgi:hypothetical protein